jgi:hypothetical protein
MRGDKAKIALELHEMARNLGAKPDLLAILARYWVTMNDSEILAALERWNNYHADLTPLEAGEPLRR